MDIAADKIDTQNVKLEIPENNGLHNNNNISGKSTFLHNIQKLDKLKIVSEVLTKTLHIKNDLLNN